MAYAQIALKLLVGLLGLILVTRLLGKKEMSQLTPFDFIYAIVLGGILEEGLYEPNTSLGQIMFALALWGAAIFLIEKSTQKSRRMRNLLKGNPSLIIENGIINTEEMKKNHLDLEQLRTMLRKQGIFTLKEVQDLYLEPGGDISIKKVESAEAVTPEMLGIKPEKTTPSILIIEGGAIIDEGLEAAHKTKKWLYDQLAKKGYAGAKDILYAEWSETDGFYIQTYPSDDNKNPG